MNATWAVKYASGRWQFQYQDGVETPYRAIEWGDVVQLRFESQDATANFDVGVVPEGYQLSLRSRHFKTLQDQASMCFMLVLSAVGRPVDDESAVDVLYWFPNGVEHRCDQFNCPDIAGYGLRVVRDQAATLMPEHHRLTTELSATIN